jgi:inactivated superfamily I helicase
MATMCDAKAVGDAQDEFLDDWLKAKDTSLAALMKLDSKEYELTSEELLKVLDGSIAEFVKAGPKEKDLIVTINTQTEANTRARVVVLGCGDGSVKHTVYQPLRPW